VEGEVHPYPILDEHLQQAVEYRGEGGAFISVHGSMHRKEMKRREGQGREERGDE
jgi:hypothetical protein